MDGRTGLNPSVRRSQPRLRPQQQEVPVGVDDISFPALGRLANGILDVLPTAEHLTLNTASGLKGGFYTGYELVDANGRWFRVVSARKLHGVGPFGGYNPFLGQKIRVELEIEDSRREASLEEVRGLVVSEFASSSSWQSRDDFDSLQAEITSASTLAELLRRLADAA